MSFSNHESKSHSYSPMKSERLEARISCEQKELFQYAASLAGRSLTDFIISAVQEAANRVVHDHDIIRLSRRDQQIFIEALLEPPKPNKALIQATKRYQKEVKI